MKGKPGNHFCFILFLDVLSLFYSHYIHVFTRVAQIKNPSNALIHHKSIELRASVKNLAYQK